MGTKKQIEEMAKDTLDYGMEKYPTGDSAFTETTLREQFYPVFLTYAEHLIKKGYRKIPENAVVLTKEELERIKGFSREEVDEISQTAIKNSRKETAEKFAQALENRLESIDTILHEDNEEVYLSANGVGELIDEICKEITEGKV